MGASPDDKLTQSDEFPLHEVYLDGYYIYLNEVTVRQFREFVRETRYFTTAEKRGAAKNWKSDGPQINLYGPVTNVTYEDAAAYCKWAGGRLPTEAEWEKAARGAFDTRLYPWGNKWNKNLFNSGFLDQKIWRRIRPWNAVYRTTCNTGCFFEGSSPYEVQDLMGNAWEWCSDYFASDYYKHSPGKNPRGPDSGASTVLKGGGVTANRLHFRISERHYDDPRAISPEYGFRCVIEPDKLNLK